MPHESSVILDSCAVKDSLVVNDAVATNDYSVGAFNIDFSNAGLKRTAAAASVGCFPIFQAHRACTITKIAIRVDTAAVGDTPLWLLAKCPTGTAFPEFGVDLFPPADLAELAGFSNMLNAEGVITNTAGNQHVFVAGGSELIVTGTTGVARSTWTAGTPNLATTAMAQGDSIWLTVTGATGTAVTAGIADVIVFWKDAAPTASTVASTDRLHYAAESDTRAISAAESLSCDYLSVKNPRGLSVAGELIRPQRLYMTTANAKTADTFISDRFYDDAVAVADDAFIPIGVCPFDCRVISAVGRNAGADGGTSGTYTLYACLPTSTTARDAVGGMTAIQDGGTTPAALAVVMIGTEESLKQIPVAGTNCVFDGELVSDNDNGNTVGTLSFIPAGSLIVVGTGTITDITQTFLSVELEAYDRVA